MNKHFVLENENFNTVHLYLCKLDRIDDYMERLKRHGFTDIKRYSFSDINNRMYSNRHHPHVMLVDDTLYFVNMSDIRSEIGIINTINHDIDEEYGFIRCFIPDPLCYWAMVNMEINEKRERYEELYENARKMRDAYHSVQEIAEAESICYEYDIFDEPTDEEKDEDILLYFEFAICK